MPFGHSRSTTVQTPPRSHEQVVGLTRERPWLLPTNRKLRHVHGITLRNICVLRAVRDFDAKSNDDEALPSTYNSPSKLLAPQENYALVHSRSQSNLVTSPTRVRQGSDHTFGPGKGKGNGSVQLRPSNMTLRRRSTLNWGNSSPLVRQTKLEDVTKIRMADCWFSVHVEGLQEPIYISETVQKSMNPGFRFFDLNAYGAGVTRQDELMVKIWTRTEGSEEYVLLTRLKACLGSLQFIGKSLESFYHPLPDNCIIFHLSDGIYTSFTDLPLNEPLTSPLKPQSKALNTRVQSTSSFDALMRLSNLDDCIQDALATRETLTKQIESLLSESQQSRGTVSSVAQVNESLASTQRAVTAARRALHTSQSRKAELATSLAKRRADLEAGRRSQQVSQLHLTSANDVFEASKENSEAATTALYGQVRRICEDLSAIFPIEPIEKRPLAFTIRDLYLPNANFFSSSNDGSEAATAAALGMVAQILYLLSHYLSCPLPYPITPHGSASTIYDPITISLATSSKSIPNKGDANPSRIFPLYPTNSVQYRFEYGVFLLNTDLELLMWKRGLRMVDQRQTLANLKYLLVVLGSGKGEIPRRKKGKVGGAGNNLSPNLSRETSEDRDGPGDGMGGERRLEVVQGKKAEGKMRVDVGKEKGRGRMVGPRSPLSAVATSRQSP